MVKYRKKRPHNKTLLGQLSESFEPSDDKKMSNNCNCDFPHHKLYKLDCNCTFDNGAVLTLVGKCLIN